MSWVRLGLYFDNTADDNGLVVFCEDSSIKMIGAESRYHRVVILLCTIVSQPVEYRIIVQLHTIFFWAQRCGIKVRQVKGLPLRLMSFLSSSEVL